MNKKKRHKDDIVYSTNPEFHLEEENKEVETLPNNQQRLKVRLDTKQRAGKLVTLVQDFVGKVEDLEDLGKKIKSFCGTGGSVKEGEIIIQGDHREKVMQWLIKNNFRQSKKV